MIAPRPDDRSPERKAADERIASRPPLPKPNIPPGTVGKPMEELPMQVESDWLASVLYQRANRVLEIELKDGSAYQYFDVPSSVYHRLLRAKSHGAFVNQEIQDVYDYQQVRESRS